MKFKFCCFQASFSREKWGVPKKSFFCKDTCRFSSRVASSPFHPWTANLISAGKWQTLLFKVTSFCFQKGSCWWKRSCITRNVWNPVNNGIKYQPQLVFHTFLPSIGIWSRIRNEIERLGPSKWYLLVPRLLFGKSFSQNSEVAGLESEPR